MYGGNNVAADLFVLFTLDKIGNIKVGVNVDKKHTLNVIRIKLQA